MKTIHFLYLVIGIFIGLAISGLNPSSTRAFAQEDKKTAMSEEELNKHLEEILEGQAKIKKRLEAITIQTQFIKASSGK
jgi:hypothetical protein